MKIKKQSQEYYIIYITYTQHKYLKKNLFFQEVFNDLVSNSGVFFFRTSAVKFHNGNGSVAYFSADFTEEFFRLKINMLWRSDKSSPGELTFGSSGICVIHDFFLKKLRSVRCRRRSSDGLRTVRNGPQFSEYAGLASGCSLHF